MFAGFSIGISILRSIVTGIDQEVKTSQGIDLYLWIPIIIIGILVILGILYYKKDSSVSKGVSPGDKNLKGSEVVKRPKEDELFKTIQDAGYLYDQEQDIFYSSMDPWQKDMGYAAFYDDFAILSGMIIDCEPIKFVYEGKEWLIEFWKGQYGLSTGCEIGVYVKENTERNIAGAYKDSFYKGVSDEDRLQMAFALKKMGKVLFTRNDKHWWLTGFKLGEFSEPTDLIMDVSITLKDFIMRDEFIKALKNVGYLKNEIFINRTTVSLRFDKPRTQQPSTRIEELDWITQRKNKMLCDKYDEITKGYNNFPDKMNAIENKAPEIYNKIINIGKSKEIFNQLKKMKK